MSESTEDAAFALEPFFSRTTGQRETHELDRSSPLEPAVTAPGEPHAPHSALANLRDQRVWAKGLARKSCGVRQRESSILQKTFLRQHPVFVEECSQLRGQYGILLAERGQPSDTLIVGHSERLIQIWA